MSRNSYLLPSSTVCQRVVLSDLSTPVLLVLDRKFTSVNSQESYAKQKGIDAIILLGQFVLQLRFRVFC